MVDNLLIGGFGLGGGPLRFPWYVVCFQLTVEVQMIMIYLKAIRFLLASHQFLFLLLQKKDRIEADRQERSCHLAALWFFGGLGKDGVKLLGFWGWSCWGFGGEAVGVWGWSCWGLGVKLLGFWGEAVGVLPGLFADPWWAFFFAAWMSIFHTI